MLSQNVERQYIDSGYSQHITGNQYLFASLLRTQGQTITFGDDEVCKIIGIDNIGKSLSTVLENILLVDSLKANIIISQLCDKGLNITF